ncbi:hypothetical protein QQ045_009349 [Rhodiola kirilowii]
MKSSLLATQSSGDPPDPRPALFGKSQAPSFLAVARGPTKSQFPAVKLAPRQYGLKDGKSAVSFTQAELQPGLQRLQHSLIAKFMAGRPQIDDV